MRTLLLHIGCAKGGSSAIQAGLRRNHRELASRGIAVPGHDLDPESEITGAHAAFFESCVRERQATAVPGLGALLEAAADTSEASTIILSAENLSNPMGFERLFVELLDRFDVRILMYVRRQDDFLEASWQQWDIKLGGSLLAWMIKSIGVRGNWGATLEPWAQAFGDERITVRVYDRERLVGRDAFLDLCDVLGQDPEGLDLPGESNPSLTPMLSRMIEGFEYLFDGPHDQAFYDSARTLAHDLVARMPEEPRLLNDEEAHAVMSVYAQTNERFRRRYLPHIKRPLFQARRPPSGDPRMSQEVFERQLLLLQIFNLHKEVEELRKTVETRWTRWTRRLRP